MAQVIVYSKERCPYCMRAKQLLDTKGVVYTEIDVTKDDAKREEMMAKSRARTLPQIFINDKPIGGFDSLYALNKSGELDKLLSGE